MKFKQGDWVLWDGQIYRVHYANDEIVVSRRRGDWHMRSDTPDELAKEQIPWVHRGRWWSPLALTSGV